MRHYQYETELDAQKKENRARLKKFMLAVDRAAYGGKVAVQNECTPMALSSMAVVATEALRFSA